jgi:hypothetical protein
MPIISRFRLSKAQPKNRAGTLRCDRSLSLFFSFSLLSAVLRSSDIRHWLTEFVDIFATFIDIFLSFHGHSVYFTDYYRRAIARSSASRPACE